MNVKAPTNLKSFKKNKNIIDNGPHYKYIDDLWHLPYYIFKKTGYNYIIDIVDHFSKWYFGYLLENKESNSCFK